MPEIGIFGQNYSLKGTYDAAYKTSFQVDLEAV